MRLRCMTTGHGTTIAAASLLGAAALLIPAEVPDSDTMSTSASVLNSSVSAPHVKAAWVPPPWHATATLVEPMAAP